MGSIDGWPPGSLDRVRTMGNKTLKIIDKGVELGDMLRFIRKPIIFR